MTADSSGALIIFHTFSYFPGELFSHIYWRIIGHLLIIIESAFITGKSQTEAMKQQSILQYPHHHKK